MKKPSFFYGYYIVASGFGIQAIGIGVLVAFGVFFVPLLGEFGWSRGTLSSVQSVAMIVAGVFAFLVGRLNDRIGPRLTMSIASPLFGLGLLLMSRVDNLWQLYMFYSILVGIGLSSIDVVPLSTTARWFVQRRGRMTGVLKVGTGVGQLAIPLISSALIAAYGWRTSYLIIGATAMVLLFCLGQVLRRDPAQMGLLPDRDTKSQTLSPESAESGFSLLEALRTRQFWMVCFIFLATMFSLGTIMTHIVPHATDIGIPAATAAGILSTIGGISMAGRVVTGMAIDRIGCRLSMIACLIMVTAAIMWLQWAGELWELYLFATVYGFGHGGLYTAMSPFVAEHFGLRAHGAILGIVISSSWVGAATGPLIAGHVFDITNSYRLAFLICIAVGVIALSLVLSLGKTRSAQEVRT